MTDLADLTPLERAVLAFEQGWRGASGLKEAQAKQAFGLSATRYYQMLAALAFDPRAMAEFPVLCATLRAQMGPRRRR